jgi:quinoprotein glucose dehydrogenase
MSSRIATGDTVSRSQRPGEHASPKKRYFTGYGLGYPYLLTPPWSTIMAYDLNRGVIMERPLGQTRADANAEGEDTGVPRGAQRQGMIVTSAGIVFSTARKKHYIVVNATTPNTWGIRSRANGASTPEPAGRGGYVVFALP